eukprot:9435413-Ditylum_brightwellii.AAC.1
MENIVSMYGFVFLNLIHNLWTSNSVACILGAFLSFINIHWEKQHLALIVWKHMLAHPAKTVANNIKTIFTSKYPDVAITNSIWSVVAHTTGCARNMADHFDSPSQLDYAMHSGSLGLQYAFGAKDNTCTTAGIQTGITHVPMMFHTQLQMNLIKAVGPLWTL